MSIRKKSPQNSLSSKKSPQKDNISLFDLLYHCVKDLARYCSPREIAHQLNANLKTVQKYLLNLSKEGYLKRIQLGREVYYIDTKISNSKSSILSSIEGDTKKHSELLKRIHKLRFRAFIREKSPQFEARLKQYPWAENPLQNWSEYHTRIALDEYEAFIRVTTKHVIVEVPEIETIDLEEAVCECYRRAEQVFRWLERKYQLKLGEIQCRFAQTQMHVALVDHPLAKFARSRGWFYVGNRIAVDSSKGRDELETIDVRHAEEDGLSLLHDYDEMLKRNIRVNEIYDLQDRLLHVLEKSMEADVYMAFKLFYNGEGLPKTPKKPKEKDNSGAMFG